MAEEAQPDGRGGLRIKGGRGQGMQGWRQSKKLVTSTRKMKEEKSTDLATEVQLQSTERARNLVTDKTAADIQRKKNCDQSELNERQYGLNILPKGMCTIQVHEVSIYPPSKVDKRIESTEAIK